MATAKSKPPPPETPECERWAALREQYLPILDFLEWLRNADETKLDPRSGKAKEGKTKPYFEICDYLPNWNYPASAGVTNLELVYRYLDIDADKLERERTALLEHQRALNT